MRRRLTKIFDKKRFIFIFGLLIGVVFMGGISYAVGSFTSDSISYTKDGKTMNVKQALDDLIVKVDQKGGNFNIELAERSLGINFTESTTTYQSLINDLLGRMITAMGTANTADLSAIKSSTLTWKSEDPNIATVNGTVVKGVKAGKTKIIGTATNGKQVIVPVNVKSAVVLADNAHVGDYVAYDAGQWSEDKSRPSSSVVFGGYSKNQSKNTSVEWCYNDSNKTTLNGWRVLSIDSGSKTVTIVHAGHPECYYFGSPNNSSQGIETMNNHADQQYKNNLYASSARSIKESDISVITDLSNSLRAIGSAYWLATGGEGSYWNGWLKKVHGTGTIDTYDNNECFGYRPVVVLKSGILTTGQEPDKVGNEKAWTLVLPN